MCELRGKWGDEFYSVCEFEVGERRRERTTHVALAEFERGDGRRKSGKISTHARFADCEMGEGIGEMIERFIVPPSKFEIPQRGGKMVEGLRISGGKT
jgi:hypothetical protein